MTSEGEILKSILEYLAVRRIWAMRMNVGAVASTYKGKSRFVRFGRPGCADILAVVQTSSYPAAEGQHWPVWLEVKTERGRQSPAQKEFEAEVKAKGHGYFVVRSIDDVIKVLQLWA